MAVSMDSIAKLPTPKKVLILFVAIVVIVGLYGYLVFMPQRENLRRLGMELAKLNRELKESEAVKRDLAVFGQQVGSLEKELALAVAQLPNKKEIPSLLRNISSLGKGSGLEFLLFKPKPEERVGAQPQGSGKPPRGARGKAQAGASGKGKPQETQEFYARVPLELIMVGSYHNVATFFDKISKLDRIINILNFSMGDVKQRGGETVVKTSCLATTFRFLETEGEAGAKKTETKGQR